METLELDMRGRPCPVPIIEAAKAMARLSDGGLLELRGDDPALERDVKAWCESTGHQLVAVERATDGANVLARIRKVARLG